MDLIIKNGTVVTAERVWPADVGVHEGKIVEIGGALSSAADVIDASGCFVLPGGVDVHTHLDAPGSGIRTVDDFLSGTIAAACGGTTTIVDFCQQAKGQTLRAALAEWHQRANDKAVIDYGFHIIVVDANESVVRELRDLPDDGITSFKVFTAYRGVQMIDDAAVLRVMEQARNAGALVMVHAENGDCAEYLREKFVAEGKVEPKYHAASRPPRVEAEATSRLIALAEVVGASIYIVHLTCEEALEEVLRGRQRGVEVFAETCTHYLYATRDDLDRDGFEGAKFVFTPPARTQEDHQVLWRALADHTMQIVSSDHVGWSFKGQKELGSQDFTKIPNGAPGIEERLIMVYQGVNEGRISLSRFVDIVATAPARMFGLFPQKGTIAIGSDADLVIWDPVAKDVMSQRWLHHKVDYSVYEGRAVQGVPRTVMSRGAVIVRDRLFTGQPGAGRFIKRAKFQPKTF